MRALKITLVCLLVLLVVAPISAQAATNGNPMSPLAGVTCNGSSCNGAPNSATNPFYIAQSTSAGLALDASIQQLVTILNAPLILPAGGSTSALQTAGNATLTSILAKQPTLNGDGGALAHVTNFPGTQPVSIATAPALVASSAIIGKVGIDQTTPGATNGVVVNSGTVTVSGAVTTTPVSTATQTTNTITAVAITATSGTLIAANANRKFLSIVNIGANACTVTTVNPAVSGAGVVYASGGPFPSQGGSNQYDSKVPTNAYYAICPTGLSTTFSVEEGN